MAVLLVLPTHANTLDRSCHLQVAVYNCGIMFYLGMLHGCMYVCQSWPFIEAMDLAFTLLNIAFLSVVSTQHMPLRYVHLQFCQCSHLDKIHGHLGSLHWGWTSQGWLVDEPPPLSHALSMQQSINNVHADVKGFNLWKSRRYWNECWFVLSYVQIDRCCLSFWHISILVYLPIKLKSSGRGIFSANFLYCVFSHCMHVNARTVSLWVFSIAKDSPFLLLIVVVVCPYGIRM